MYEKINSLIKLANFLDKNKKYEEASLTDYIIKKISGDVHEISSGRKIPEDELKVPFHFPKEMSELARADPGVNHNIYFYEWPDEAQKEQLLLIIEEFNDMDDSEKEISELFAGSNFLASSNLWFNVYLDLEDTNLLLVTLVDYESKQQLATGENWIQLIGQLKLSLGMRDLTQQERNMVDYYADTADIDSWVDENREMFSVGREDEQFVEPKGGDVLDFKPIEYVEGED